jgi:hypothetical protein
MAKVLQDAIRNFSEHMQARDHPACFTEKEYIAWKKHEIDMPTVPIRGFVCRDCSPEYQRRMTLEGRCVNSSIQLEKIVD